MKINIRGATALLAIALTAGAQSKDQEQQAPAGGVVSGTAYTFLDRSGSGTITFSYSFTGTPTGVSIAVQGCAQDGVTCTTLTPTSGAAPYTTSASGQQTFTGGYALYKVTPVFTGATLYIYKVGIQAKTSTPAMSGGSSGSAGTVQAADGNGGFQAVPSQSANTVYASPNGAAGTPSFRSLVAADIPALPYAPTVNPAGGQQNYAPIASPTFTGTLTALMGTFNTFMAKGTISSESSLGYPNVRVGVGPSGDTGRIVSENSSGDVAEMDVLAGGWRFYNSAIGQFGQIAPTNASFKALNSTPIGQTTPAAVKATVFGGSPSSLVASATIAPTTSFLTITGASTTITTMTPPTGISGASGYIDMVAVNSQTIAAGTGAGQFKTGFTMSADVPYHCAYNFNSDTLWRCK